jgi:hypothetical protein
MAVLDTNPAMTTASVVVLSSRGVESKGLRRGLCGHGRLGNGRKKKEPSDVEV